MKAPSDGQSIYDRIDVVALALAAVLAAAIVFLLVQIVPQLADLMMPPPLSGREVDRLILPAPFKDPRPVPERDFGTRPTSHRRQVSLQRDQEIADTGNLFDRFSPVALSQRSIV